MAHQSLYRKYRPQTFGDVVGQEHIERTLMNAVAEGKVAHAYLFTGPRGTGKTTTARIVAKALNCQHGPTAEPDGTCEDCIEIAEGRHPDVYELDAASRTGVDNVREEIIGRVDFAPTRGRYKVYIIDEVHMLSTAAFNALLKTLEEPPSRVIFILATTHPHKVPETIQSRCQRFDFHRIGVDDIVRRLRVIVDAEGFDVPDAALTLIARHAAGGMRDAITTLEQLASFSGGSVTLGDVEGLLGEVDTAQLFEIAGLVARRDIAGAFRWVARFAEQGTDLAEFVRELTSHVRDLYVIAAVGDSSGIIDATADEVAQLDAQAAEFGGPDRLARVLDVLGELGAELRWSSDQRLSLEVALTRLARPGSDLTLESLAERVEGLELAGPATAAALRSGSSPGALTPSASTPAAESSLRAATVAGPPASGAANPPVPTRASGPAPVAPVGSADPSKTLAAEAEAVPQTTNTTPASMPATPAPEAPIVTEAHHAGGLDRGTVRRAWPAVLAEIKKLKPGRAQLFGLAEADVDLDGESLVIEFPSDAAFSIQLAEDPDVREVLRRALFSALGFAPPVRYQLGKGKVRPADPEPAPAAVAPLPRQAADGGDSDEGPVPEYYETSGAEPVQPAPRSAAPQPAPASVGEPDSDLRRLLTEQLGAQIVAERAAPTETTSAAEIDDDGAAEELAESDPASMFDEPGLFESDQGEDE